MTQWVDQLKETIPDYAKDARLNIDAVIKRSTLSPEEAEACAVAAAFATGNTKFWTWLHSE
jgi:alkyl hydroperoxide reductase subunit D